MSDLYDECPDDAYLDYPMMCSGRVTEMKEAKMDEKMKERFWIKVDKRIPDGCWEWKGAILKNGYGRFWDGERNVLAHRFVYELCIHRITEKQHLDHICSNRGCVNPSHLQVLSNRENILKGNGPTAKNFRKTLCKRGHILTAGKFKQNGEWRICLECAKETRRKWLRNNRETAREATRKWRANKRIALSQ